MSHLRTELRDEADDCWCYLAGPQPCRKCEKIFELMAILDEEAAESREHDGEMGGDA